MSLRADAAADLADILADDDAGEAALWRPAGVGGVACRVTVGAATGSLGLAAGLDLEALAVVAARAALAQAAQSVEGVARDPLPGDVLSLTDPASAAAGTWLVVAVDGDLLGAVRLGLVARATATATGLGTVTALVHPTLDHLVAGEAGEALEREADAVVGGALVLGSVVTVAAGEAAGEWAVVAITSRDGGLVRCRLRWRERTRSNDPAVRRVPR